MEILVCEARHAEREIPLGEGWRRRRAFQEGGILPRGRRGGRSMLLRPDPVDPVIPPQCDERTAAAPGSGTRPQETA
jgi:hypothetical protein